MVLFGHHKPVHQTALSMVCAILYEPLINFDKNQAFKICISDRYDAKHSEL